MKKSFLVLLVLLVFAFAASSWGQCPEDEYDLGECDTLHIIPLTEDIPWGGKDGPYTVRVALRVTCDIVDELDSIAAFVIPLCIEQMTNVSKYCSVSAYWNNTYLYPFPPSFLERSIFRHLSTAPADSNWMMRLSEAMAGLEWDTIILELDGTSNFWFTMFPTGGQDERFPSGNRILLATMTFRLEDTMTVCIDSCFWPPANRLGFIVVREGQTKIPRSGTRTESFEVCFPSMVDVKEIETSEENRPSEFSLSQNYPNPFNPNTSFRFTLAKSSKVKIEIFNIVGQRVRTLVDEDMKAGAYVAEWDGQDDKGVSVSSGIYFYRMQAADFSEMKKMLLVK